MKTFDVLIQNVKTGKGKVVTIEAEPEPLPTVEQFIEKHGITFECHRVDSRPDGLMQNDMRHFRCRVKYTHKSFGLYFSQGSGHKDAPTLADVLDCLAMDASGYENAHVKADGAYHTTDNERSKNYDLPMHFHNWASEYGYDTDSRSAEKIFRATKRQAQQLKQTLGMEAYEELLYSVERL